MSSGAWNVYKPGKRKPIDTVFHNEGTTAWNVWHGLINHDGYDPDIIVVSQDNRRNRWPKSAKIIP